MLLIHVPKAVLTLAATQGCSELLLLQTPDLKAILKNWIFYHLTDLEDLFSACSWVGLVKQFQCSTNNMWNLFGQHTQAYITFVFVIIKTIHSIRMRSTNCPFLMMTNQMTIREQQAVSAKRVKPKKRKSLAWATQAKSNQNNHGHAYLPPFGIIEKGLGRANKVNQGVCN